MVDRKLIVVVMVYKEKSLPQKNPSSSSCGWHESNLVTYFTLQRQKERTNIQRFLSHLDFCVGDAVRSHATELVRISGTAPSGPVSCSFAFVFCSLHVHSQLIAGADVADKSVFEGEVGLLARI